MFTSIRTVLVHDLEEQSVGKPLPLTINNIMKMNDYVKKFDASKFVTINPEDYKNISGGQSIIVSAKDLDNENLKNLVSQMEEDTRKGVGIYFKPGETIFFPKFEDMVFEFTGFEIYNGQLRINLKVSSYTERYETFMFPLSIFRRVPLDEPIVIRDEDGNDIEYPSGRDLLLKDNPLGAILIRNVLSDLDRCKHICYKVVRVTDKLKLAQPKFVQVGDKMERTGESRPLTCYKFSFVE